MFSCVGALGNELRHWLLGSPQVLSGVVPKQIDVLGMSERGCGFCSGVWDSRGLGCITESGWKQEEEPQQWV